MEKTAVDEQMNLERHQRKTIAGMKESELEKAKEDLFKDLDEVNELDQKLV